MATDIPAAPRARLAAIRAAHAEQSRPWDPYPTCAACTRCGCYQPVAWPCDVARVLAAFDAEAARLAYVRAHEADLGAGYLALSRWRSELEALDG